MIKKMIDGVVIKPFKGVGKKSTKRFGVSKVLPKGGMDLAKPRMPNVLKGVDSLFPFKKKR